MTRKIPLTKGKVALVDDEDYSELSKYNWYVTRSHNVYYAIRGIRPIVAIGGKYQNILMHRVILGTPDGMYTDHINGDGLDNRRENLRVVTRRENGQNKHIKKSSKYPGVCWDKERMSWLAYIVISKKLRYLGRFADESEAGTAYRVACAHLIVGETV